jgi:hypothetical protein
MCRRALEGHGGKAPFVHRTAKPANSPEERAKNKRLLDDLRLAMVEYSEAFEQAIRS